MSAREDARLALVRAGREVGRLLNAYAGEKDIVAVAVDDAIVAVAIGDMRARLERLLANAGIAEPETIPSWWLDQVADALGERRGSLTTARDLAGRRLKDSRGSVRHAFDSLECGITFDDLLTYVEDGHLLAIRNQPDPDVAYARLVGYVAAVAITVVEADRASRGGTT